MSKLNEESTAIDQSGLKVARSKRAGKRKEASPTAVFQPNAAGIDMDRSQRDLRGGACGPG